MARGRKTGGRKRGTPNQSTALLRAAILEALELNGGSRYFVRVAKLDPATFLRLLGRLLPPTTKHEAADERLATITVVTGFPDAPSIGGEGPAGR